MSSTRDQRRAYVVSLYVIALLVIGSIIVALFTTTINANHLTFASQEVNQYGTTTMTASENTTSTPIPEFSSGLQIFLLALAMLAGMFLVMKVYYKRIGNQAP